MIMDSSSSSSKQLPEESVAEKLKCMVSNCLILSPFTIPHFIHDPFVPSLSPTISKQPTGSSSNNQNLHCLVKTRKPHHFLDEFHCSIASTADRFVNFLNVMASHNPFVTKLFSFRSDFQNFCQIHRINYVKLNALPSHNFAAILPGDSVAGVVVANGILNFLNIYNTLLVCRLVLTWFPNSPPAIVSPLSTLCDPYLNIFRGLIPPLGGSLDLSPILAFLVLNALTSTASALPAELPSAGSSQGIPSSHSVSDLTGSQKKWMQRFAANKSKVSNNGN